MFSYHKKIFEVGNLIDKRIILLSFWLCRPKVPDWTVLLIQILMGKLLLSGFPRYECVMEDYVHNETTIE